MTDTYRANFTFAAFEAKLREIIAADPGHIYRMGDFHSTDGMGYSCFYLASHPGAHEACVMGVAMTALGVPDRFLAEREGRPVQAILSEAGVTSLADFWLARLQSEQDHGTPWGEALAEADAAHPLR